MNNQILIMKQTKKLRRNFCSRLQVFVNYIVYFYSFFLSFLNYLWNKFFPLKSDRAECMRESEGKISFKFTLSLHYIFFSHTKNNVRYIQKFWKPGSLYANFSLIFCEESTKTKMKVHYNCGSIITVFDCINFSVFP